MSNSNLGPTLAREADRLYGELLILLGLLALAAPFFVEATLAGSLLLAGAAGVWWIALDRSTRGLVAAAAWSLIALGLGAHLTFHILLGVIPLDLALGLGFGLLGLAELVLGEERYRGRRVARRLLVLGGAAAIAFGVAVPIVWPAVPDWAGGVTVFVMFVGMGGALVADDVRRRARQASDGPPGAA